nr:GMC family oxidoreductase [Cylindrospermopsis raciborskii]
MDQNLKSWDHPNLYLVGSGSMPTIGTSNTTVTIAASLLKLLNRCSKSYKSLSGNFLGVLLVLLSEFRTDYY